MNITKIFSGLFIAIAMAVVLVSPAKAEAQIYENSSYYYGTNYGYTYPYSYPYNYTYNNYLPLTVNCSSYSTNVNTGDTVTWSATANGGSGSYTYSWSGTDGFNAYGQTVTNRYWNYGPKTVNVTVTSNGQSVMQNCGTVNVNNPSYGYPYPVNPVYPAYPVYPSNLQIACSASATSVRVGEPVIWNVEATGAIGNVSYSWTGTDGLVSNQPSAITTYVTPGTKSASVTVTSNGQSRSTSCVNTVSVKSVAVAPSTVRVITQPAPVVQVQHMPATTLSAASLFSLNNVPWGWVAVLVILILIGIVFYLLFNRKKM